MDIPITVEDTMAAILGEVELSVVMEEVVSVVETEGAGAGAAAEAVMEEEVAEAVVSRVSGKSYCGV